MMKWGSIGIAVLILSLGWTGSAHAGVYSTVEPVFKLNDDYGKFLDDTLIPLKRIGTPDVNLEKVDWLRCYSLAGKALQQLKDPPTKDGKDPFTVEDRLNMSACLLRMRDPKGAIEVLRPVEWEDPGNFLVMSNRGTAFLMAGDYRSAFDWLSNARPFWRKSFEDLRQERRSRPYVEFLVKRMGWNEHQFAWYARCEKYQLRLAKVRYYETEKLARLKKQLDFTRMLEDVDDLLVDPEKEPPPEGPRFVTPDGKFEPGKIAAAEKAKIPRDALPVVQQLLVWMPEDARLIWLMGEVLNARGDVESARKVFSEFLSRFAQRQEFSGFGKVSNPEVLYAKFLERHPVVGMRLKALREYVAPLPVEPAHEPPTAKKAQPETAPAKKTPGKDEPTAGLLKLDWQALGIGFGSGALVAVLASWQLREILRRRQARAARAAENWSAVTSSGSTDIQEKR
jgi:hypothetical protein